MQCSKCGKILSDESKFCTQCGTAVDTVHTDTTARLLYQLAEKKERSYRITVSSDHVLFYGDFWYLKDKEFVKCRGRQEQALIQNFLGMGYLAKRSFRKCLLFVIAGSALETVKMIIDQLSEWMDKANNVLQWFDKEIHLPACQRKTQYLVDLSPKVG